MPDDSVPARELDLRDYVQVLRRRRGTIALTVLLVVGVALAYSLRQSKTYEATAQVLLQLSGGQAGAGEESTGRATELLLIAAPAMRAAVAEKLGHPPDVSVEPIGSTDVVGITARSKSGRRAARDANVYAQVYIDQHREQGTAEYLRVRKLIGDLDARVAVLDTEVAAASPADRSTLLAQQATERSRIAGERSDAAAELETLLPVSAAQGARLVAKASEPTSPAKPNTPRNILIALVVGLVLGVGAAFVREHFDDTVQSRDDIERVSGGLAVVGTIPSARSTERKKRDPPEVVASSSPSSRPAEAYRTLRTSLLFMTVSRPIGSLQVTSASAVDGKTTTVANLAVTTARAGHRVVVACCDLRRPRVHEFLGVTNEFGLTSVLLGEVPLEDAVQSAETEPDVFVLSSGPPPPNPAELLALPRTAEILRLLQERCDLLIVDSPPVLPVTDALIVSGLVDATLIVATVGTTKKQGLQRAVELLRQVDAPLVGAVLNYPASRTGFGYESGYGYGYGPQTLSDNGASRRQDRKAPVSDSGT